MVINEICMMNYSEELNKALNNIFFDGLKSHVENCIVKKLGNNWTQKIAEYTDNWRDPLDFNELGDPNWDFGKIVRFFGIKYFQDDFKINRGRERNLAFALRDTRNQLAHNKIISLEHLASAIYNMKVIADIFEDDACLNSLNEFSDKIYKINLVNLTTNNTNSPKIEIEPDENDDLEDYYIDSLNRFVAPLNLIGVREGTRGKNNAKAILLKFNNIDSEIGCNFQDGFNERLEKCKNLINQNVKVYWVSDTFTFEKGWFSDIELYEKKASHVNTSTNNETQQSKFLIIKVECVPGSQLKSNWRNPMWVITTDKGEFINTVADIREDQIKPGMSVDAYISKSGIHKWLNIK